MSRSDVAGPTSASVLQDIIDRAHLDPHHPAAKDLDRALSYAELLQETASLAAGLRARGVRSGDRVALLIPNSVDFVVAALATLWVGAIFVPLAMTDPQTRLETVVTNASPALVLTSARDGVGHPLTLSGVSLVSMHQLLDEDHGLAEPMTPESRAVYIIYTSGTTGAPKGVQIGDDAFTASVRSTAAALGLNPTTRTLCVSPFHFDGAYANVFPTLVSGGTIVMRPRDALLFPRTFFKAVANEAITYSGFTPSYLRLLLASREISALKDSSLQMIALGGEAVTVADLQALWSYAPSIRVFNRYGPTEATIAVTNVELTPATIEGGTITFGRPHPGVSFEVMDDNGQVIEEANRTGELFIGGVQLMDGYWGDPALTQSVMHDTGNGEVKYRTGDLVYRDELGNYVYVDRADRVVKRSGVRISLVELNALMSTVEGVVAAACVTYDRDGELGIAAFVTTSRELSDVELRRALRTLIPDNMLPDTIEHVATMPLNRSNQLDEAQLLTAAGLRPYRRTST